MALNDEGVVIWKQTCLGLSENIKECEFDGHSSKHVEYEWTIITAS